MRRIWNYLREVRWPAVLAIVCSIAAAVVVLTVGFAAGIAWVVVLGVAAVVFAILSLRD